jgi:hypothetical protein
VTLTVRPFHDTVLTPAGTKTSSGSTAAVSPASSIPLPPSSCALRTSSGPRTRTGPALVSARQNVSAVASSASRRSRSRPPVCTSTRPGSQYFPGVSPGTFATPPAAARVKFRWWQPVADTNDAEIQSEVSAMAGNFGGGFEQNGFPVNMNCGGCTSQYQTYADSQQFGQQYGWGSPLWSQRTQIYQRAAAQEDVIGDMNEGSRWNNKDPSEELPPVTAPALGGESTALSVTANPGDGAIQVQPCHDQARKGHPCGI